MTIEEAPKKMHTHAEPIHPLGYIFVIICVCSSVIGTIIQCYH